MQDSSAKARERPSLLLLGFALIFLAILYQYAPLLRAGFPMEEETARWLKTLGDCPWPRVPLAPSYWAVHPTTNVLLKLGAIVNSAEPRLLYWAVLLLHLANTFVVFQITRRLVSLGVLGTEPEPGAPGASERHAAQVRVVPWLAAVAFAVSNSYYYLFISVLNMAAAGVFYSLILYCILITIGLLTRDRRAPWLEAAAVAIAVVLPFHFYGAPVFLPLMAVVLLAVPAAWKRRRRVGLLLAVPHLVSLALNTVFFNGVVSSWYIYGSRTAPSDFGLMKNLAANPLNFLMVAAHTALGGVQFGLLYQNFLFICDPYSLSYVVGALVCLLYVCEGFFTRPRLRRANLVLCILIFIPLFITCFMRNPLSGEQGRVFDTYMVAGSPRYFYFPAAPLAVSFGLTMFSLLQRVRRRPALWKTVAILLGTFLLLSAHTTRVKIGHYGRVKNVRHYYTPRGLNPAAQK